MYKFLKSKSSEESSIEKEIPSEKLTNQDIIQWGVSNKDKICNEVVKMQLAMIANEIASHMCRIMPFGGVYIVGSLIIALSQYIQDNKEEIFLVFIH